MRLLLPLLFTVVIAQAAAPSEKIENIRSLLRDRKLIEAESAANALVAANRGDAAAYALLGSVCMAKGEADAAVKACEKAVELAPANSEYQCQLGDTCGFAAQNAGMLSKMNFARKCRNAYEKAVELDPANLDARSSLMGFYQMAPGVMGGGIDKAYEQAAAIRKLDAKRGHLAFATVYAADKKFDLALAECEEVLKISPDDYAALYQVGKLAAVSGQFLDRGLASLRRCVELPPPDVSGTPGHAAVQWRIGNILEKKNDPVAARAAYEAALKLDPKFTPAADALKKIK